MIIKTSVDKERVINKLQLLNLEKPWSVDIKLYKKNRSNSQNKLMWKWFKEIADELGHDNTDVVYADIVEMFLPLIYYTGLDGESKQRRQGTSSLNTKEFTLFLESVDRWAITFLGMTLSSPSDLYFEAMGIRR